MSNGKQLANCILATLVATGLSTATMTAHAGGAPDTEKCYGIVKQGMNSCGNSQHPCAAQAKQDGDPNEWIYVIKGTCDSIVGGSLTPKKDA